jgi:hypothetical protein
MVVSVPSSAQSVSSTARAFSPTGCATCSIGLANSMELTRARVILGQRAALPGYGVERRRLQFQGQFWASVPSSETSSSSGPCKAGQEVVGA